MTLMIRELKSAMFLHMQAGKQTNETPKALPQNTGNVFVTFSYNGGGGGGWAASESRRASMSAGDFSPQNHKQYLKSMNIS